MLKKLIVIICTLALLFCGACSNNKETQSQEESVEESAMTLFLQVIQKVEDAHSFYTIAEGEAKSLTVKQKIASKRYVIGDTMFKETISCSSIVKIATQTYVANGKYLIRESEKVSSVTEVSWQDTATDIGETEYINRYGSVILGLNNYVLNEQTITSISHVKNDGENEFVITADTELATGQIVKEMKINANSKSEPTFVSIKMTVKTDESLAVTSVRYESEYKIDVAILGEVTCREDITETYYDFNQVTAIPEHSFFVQYF